MLYIKPYNVALGISFRFDDVFKMIGEIVRIKAKVIANQLSEADLTHVEGSF